MGSGEAHAAAAAEASISADKLLVLGRGKAGRVLGQIVGQGQRGGKRREGKGLSQQAGSRFALFMFCKMGYLNELLQQREDIKISLKFNCASWLVPTG